MVCWAVQLNSAWKSFESSIMRRLVLKDGIRMDGRKVTDIRPIWSRAGVLPRTHGSALFTRGETQVRGGAWSLICVLFVVACALLVRRLVRRLAIKPAGIVSKPT